MSSIQRACVSLATFPTNVSSIATFANAAALMLAHATSAEAMLLRCISFGSEEKAMFAMSTLIEFARQTVRVVVVREE